MSTQLPALRPQGGLSRLFSLRGLFGRRSPLRLVAVPKDPVVGDKAVGTAMLRGTFVAGSHQVPVDGLTDGALASDVAARLHSFAWLRDLAAAATHERGSPTAEKLVQSWLTAFGTGSPETAWRADLSGRRILFAVSYAPYILSTREPGYRARLLGSLVESARRAERGGDRIAPGLDRIAAWSGVACAALVIQGSLRIGRAEAGLAKALKTGLHDDGGLVSRSPIQQRQLVELLGMVRNSYFAVGRPMPEWLHEAEEAALSALLCVVMGDASLSSWQGDNPGDPRRLVAAIESASEDARPLRQARGWGYQRLQEKDTVIVMDAAPPPQDDLNPFGCASTLAFEMSDGAQRLVVNCGGPGATPDLLPAEFVKLLRSTAAHSTLTLADTNSTAILDNGGLGKGVTSLDMERDTQDGGARVIAGHDGYAKRYGLDHKRTLKLSADGRELIGDDELVAVARRPSGDEIPFAVRFHLGVGVDAAPTADGYGALLRVKGRKAAWQFRARGGRLTVEESVWIDGEGVPHGTLQLVISGNVTGQGTQIGWEFKKAG